MDTYRREEAGGAAATVAGFGGRALVGRESAPCGCVPPSTIAGLAAGNRELRPETWHVFRWPTAASGESPMRSASERVHGFCSWSGLIRPHGPCSAGIM